MPKHKYRWMRKNAKYFQPFEEWKRSPEAKVHIPPDLIVTDRVNRHGAEHLPVITAGLRPAANALGLIMNEPRRSNEVKLEANQVSAGKKRSRDVLDEPSAVRDVELNEADVATSQGPVAPKRSPHKKAKTSPAPDSTTIPGLSLEWIPVNIDGAGLVQPVPIRPWEKRQDIVLP
jgi:hypothetical protein